MTVVPSGKINRKLVYNLSRYILNDEDNVDSKDGERDDVSICRDKYFMSLFTLSRFRKNLMLLAML